MDKGRYSQRYLSCFAALGLLTQLLLAAAHMHWSGPHGIHATASASHDTSRMPGGPGHHDDEFCPLCWAQTAAGSPLVPLAIELRIPASIADIGLSPVFHRLDERTASNAFRPRAPPRIRLRLMA
jgi:hypothetical protein